MLWRHAQSSWADASLADIDRSLTSRGRRAAATADDLVDRLRPLSDEEDEVILVGHDPGLQILALRLANDASDPLVQAIEAPLPTCAVVRFDVPGTWSGLAPGGARVTALHTAHGHAAEG